MSPKAGRLRIVCLISSLRPLMNSPVIILLRWAERAPTFFEMDISLSFNTTMISLFRCPAWLSASKDMPPVREPSPMTATIR